jgi:formate dehydrogenase iron-sulfur subunit
VIADIYRQRVETRGYGPELWGWKIAYGKPMRGGAVQATGDGPRPNQNLNDSQNDEGRLP